MTYLYSMSPKDKPLVWLRGKIESPPLSDEARLEAGFLLRRLQQGEKLSLPQSRPMPSVGKRCHELRIDDKNVTWRIMHRIDPDAIIILDIFDKKTRETPRRVIDDCQKRIRQYDNDLKG
jgi:phage-related protein